jgi:hypothetical protein
VAGLPGLLEVRLARVGEIHDAGQVGDDLEAGQAGAGRGKRQRRNSA